MRALCITAFASLISLPHAVHAEDRLAPGIWTNTEDAYFAEEEGRERPEPVLIEVGADRRWRPIDAYGMARGDWQEGAIPGLSVRKDGTGWQIGTSEIRRARPFSCWVSVRKFAAKPDGTPDWTFAGNLTSFDQGGRITISGKGEAPDVSIRLRNVTWAKGSRNKPALVLYVHKDDPERAESYSWASPDASLVGINLRWMQGSCTRTGN
ncbi:MAG: hypothetical protein OHK0018_12490 [Erythrobacter tepidarius]